MLTVLIVFISLGLGVLAGYLLRNHKKFLLAFESVSMLAIYILLFFLGAGMGQDDELFMQLPKLGGKAFIISCTVAVGSIIFTLPLQRFFNKDKNDKKDQNNDKVEEKLTSKDNDKSGSSPIWSSLKIAMFFVFGVFAARLDILPIWAYNASLIDYALWLLVFSVGTSLGAEIQTFAIVKKTPFLLLSIPLLIVAGSLASSALLALIMGENIKDFMTVASGFGYYSLASIIVDQGGNSYLATLTLLSNLIRELLGVLLTPLSARLLGSISPLSLAGAPAMDICLPIIAKFSGEKEAIAAVISGMLLTLFVPFIVSFFVYI